MTASEADLEVLTEVLDHLLDRHVSHQEQEPKIAKAYLRVYNRLRKVYMRIDDTQNKVAGNA
jgi:hypothetical protein